MDFADRLTTLRKGRGLARQMLADTVGVHIAEPRRFEPGTNQPTLDVLRALAITTDDLVFNEDERGPQDPSLRIHVAALDQLDPDERAGIRALIDGALLRHRARRLSAR